MKFNDLSIQEKAAVIKLGVGGGLRSLLEIRLFWDGMPDDPPVILKVNKSSADFVLRLKDPNREYIRDWLNPDDIATHKMSWADDGVVYPLVLNVNGRLVDFSRPPYSTWAGYDNAVRNGDTIHMTPEEAEWFTTHYKDYYPGFDEYKKGGSIHIKPENRGKFTALKKRTGHSASWFKAHGTPALRKMATFALNARKWHHKHPDGGYLDKYDFGPKYNMPNEFANMLTLGAMHGFNWEPEKPVDQNELYNRLMYLESEGDPMAYNSNSKAMGLFLITPIALQEYLNYNPNDIGDLYDPEYNKKVRDWHMLHYYDTVDWSKYGYPSERRKYTLSSAFFNYGKGNVNKSIEKARKNGLDIYNGDGWMTYLPDETRNYVNFLFNDADASKYKTLEKYLKWVSDGNKHIRAYGGLKGRETIFDRWRKYMEDNTIDVPMTFRLPEVQVTAQAPRPGDANYDKYIANTYDAWLRGDVDINTLPTETRNRVRGYSGTIAALKGMDTAAKVAGITAAIPLGIIGGISASPYIVSTAETLGNSTIGQQIYHGINAIAPGTAEWMLLPTWLKVGTAAADIGFTGYNMNEFIKNPNVENGIGTVLGALPYLTPAGKEIYDLATYKKIPEYLNHIKTNQKQFSEYNIANRKVANRILPMIDDIKSRRKLATSTRKLDYMDLQLDIDGNIVKTDFAYDPGIIKINSDVPYDEWSGMHEFGHHVDYTFGLPSQDIQLLSNYNYYNRDPRVHYLNNQYPGIEQEKTEQFADMFANTFSNKRPFDFNVNENVANRILATENYDLPNWNLMSSANHNNLKDELFPKGARLREEFNNNFPVLIKPLAEGADIEKQLSKTGTISRNSLDTYIKKQGKFYQEIMNSILDSDFANVDKIDYQLFKKAISRKLPKYYRSRQTLFEDYGVNRLGFNNPLDDVLLWNDLSVFDYGMRHNIILERYNIEGSFPYYEFYDKQTGLEVDYTEIADFVRNNTDFTSDYPNLSTFTFESPGIKGNTKHYQGNPIGHSRTYTTKDEPDILHVMESQSDWALGYEAPRLSEKGLKTHYDRIERLNREILDNEEKLKKGIAPDGHKLEYDYEIQLVKDIIQRDKDRLKELLSTLDQINNPNLYKNMTENYQSRLILENLRYAAEQGLSKMRYPTRETAAKIEGYSKEPIYLDANNNQVSFDDAHTFGDENIDKKINELGKLIDLRHDEVTRLQLNHLVIDWDEFDRENGRIIAEINKIKDGRTLLLKEGYFKSFVYPDEYETILKKYSDFPKQYKKLFKDAEVRTVTDSKGNTWYEVDVSEKYQKGKAEILMNLTPYLGLGLSSAALNKKKALGGPIKPFSYLPIPEVRY